MSLVKHRKDVDSVSVVHSLGESLAGLSEICQRLFLAMAVQVIRTRSRDIEIGVSDFESAGAARCSWFASVYDAAHELMRVTWTSEYDGKNERAVIAQISSSEIEIAKGKMRLKISAAAYDSIVDLHAKYTLLHLGVMRMIRGGTRVGVYIVLARWDNAGGVSYKMQELRELTRSNTPPNKFFQQTVLPLISFLNNNADEVFICEKDENGYGNRTILNFKWPKGALGRLAEKLSGPRLPGLEIASDPEGELYNIAEAAMRQSGVFDPNMPEWLQKVSAKDALEIVRKGIELGKTKGVLRDWVFFQLLEYKEAQFRREVAKSRNSEDAKNLANARKTAEEEEKLSLDWFETASDVEVARAAIKLEDYNWNMFLPDFPKPNSMDEMISSMCRLRQQLKNNPTLVVFLAGKGGIIEEE